MDNHSIFLIIRRVEKKLGVIWSLPEGYTIDGVLKQISRKGQVLLGVAFPINSKQFRYPFHGYVYLKTRSRHLYKIF